MMSSVKNVIVTGFGPFRGFSENPSSIVLDELEKNGIDGVNLILHKMSVEYDEVGRKVPELWKKHNPELVIHIGAHKIEKVIKIEQQAFADGYCENDVAGCTPAGNQTGCCRVETVLQSTIDCEKLAADVTQKCGLDGNACNGLCIRKSEDPGRYLCGFSYFLSLHEDVNKALFVHVPPFDGAIDKVAISEVIRQIIQSVLKL